MQKRLIYLSRSRLHRNRANLLQTLHTVAAFDQLGVQVALYLPPWRKELVVKERLAGFGIHHSLDLRGTRLLHSAWQPWGGRLFCLLKRAAMLRADAVYVRSPDLSLLLAEARIPHSLEVHEARGLVDGPAYRRIIEHYRQGMVQRFFPISETAAGILQEWGAAPERMTVSPCGVDLSAFEAVPVLDPGRLAQPTVTYLGRLSRSRGLDIFREIARRQLATIVLVGEAEEELAPSPFFEVHPVVPHREVPGWYARTDIVLLPYQDELRHANSISPLKLFEAMAAGRPIIASALPAIREVIRDGETGLLVPPAAADAWAMAIGRLREEPALALRLAENARKASKRYSWRSRVEKIAGGFGWR